MLRCIPVVQFPSELKVRIFSFRPFLNITQNRAIHSRREIFLAPLSPENFCILKDSEKAAVTPPILKTGKIPQKKGGKRKELTLPSRIIIKSAPKKLRIPSVRSAGAERTPSIRNSRSEHSTRLSVAFQT